MKILITGAAGFIGSHLCETLIEKHKIFGLDNFCDFYNPQIKWNNVSNLQQSSNFTLLEADIRDENALKEIFSKHEFDLVIHLAAMAGVRSSIENPQLYTEVNINGTVNLLEECKKQNIKKFIFSSSSQLFESI